MGENFPLLGFPKRFSRFIFSFNSNYTLENISIFVDNHGEF